MIQRSQVRRSALYALSHIMREMIFAHYPATMSFARVASVSGLHGVALALYAGECLSVLVIVHDIYI